SGCLDRIAGHENVLRHALGSRIDHLAIQRCCTLALLLGLTKGNDGALRLVHFSRSWREYFVGHGDLRRMDRPFAFETKSGNTACRGLVAFRIVNAAKRTVDRAQTVCTASHEHARQRSMPLVARIVRIQTTD